MIAIIDPIHIDEVVGEPPRDDRQKQARILGSDVAKRVWNVPRTDHERPSRSGHLLLADGDFELPLPTVEDVRLMAMNMKRRPVSRRYLLLQNGVRPPRFLAHDLEGALAVQRRDPSPRHG